MKAAAITAAVLIAAGTVSAAAPPHTTALLFHPTKTALAQISHTMRASVQSLHLDGKATLDVIASCKATSPAVNTKGLGYRHIVCTFSGPGPLAVHGSVLFSVRGHAAVYTGRVCALGLCEPMTGSE